MKRILMALLLLALVAPVWAQSKTPAKAKTPVKTQQSVKDDSPKEALPKVYDEKADPMAQIDEALEEARSSDRLVICQVGGNWCPWCLRFAHFITNNEAIAEVIKENFVYIHINVSKDQKHPEVMQRLGNPGRFGYPVLVILDQDGQVLHIQNTSYLEEEKSYNEKKVLQFFQNWTRKAIETVR